MAGIRREATRGSRGRLTISSSAARVEVSSACECMALVLSGPSVPPTSPKLWFVGMLELITSYASSSMDRSATMSCVRHEVGLGLGSDEVGLNWVRG